MARVYSSPVILAGILLLLVLAYSEESLAQPTTYAFDTTADKGYVIAEYREDVWVNPGPKRMDLVYLTRFDSVDQLRWQSTLNLSTVRAIVSTRDGGFFLVGDAAVSQGDREVLVRLDANGRIEWWRGWEVDNPDERYVVEILAHEDGGCIIILSSNNAGGIYLLRYDAEGMRLWARMYYKPNSLPFDSDGFDGLAVRSVHSISDGTFVVIAVASKPSISINGAVNIIRFKETGELYSINTYKTYRTLRIFDAIAVESGDLYICGAVEGQAAVMRFDTAGALKWYRAYGMPSDGELSGAAEPLDSATAIVMTDTDALLVAVAGSGEYGFLRLDTAGGAEGMWRMPSDSTSMRIASMRRQGESLLLEGPGYFTPYRYQWHHTTLRLQWSDPLAGSPCHTLSADPREILVLDHYAPYRSRLVSGNAFEEREVDSPLRIGAPVVLYHPLCSIREAFE